MKKNQSPNFVLNSDKQKWFQNMNLSLFILDTNWSSEILLFPNSASKQTFFVAKNEIEAKDFQVRFLENYVISTTSSN